MPGINPVKFENTLREGVEQANKVFRESEMVKCCDWAPVGELPKVNSTPIQEIPFVADWAVGKVHVKAPETAYTSPFAPTGK